LTTPAGKPGLTVSSSAIIPHLNANLLQGYAAANLNRVGASSNETLFGLDSTETDGTVTITVPIKGFVKLEATFLASDVFAGSRCSLCVLEARLHDVTANTDSPVTIASAATGTSAETYLPVSLQWVVPAAAGAHQYTLTSGQSDTGGPLAVYNPVLTAQYVPVGSTGSPSSLAGTTTSRPSNATPTAENPVTRGH
jgi:hypothetical protein